MLKTSHRYFTDELNIPRWTISWFETPDDWPDGAFGLVQVRLSHIWFNGRWITTEVSRSRVL